MERLTGAEIIIRLLERQGVRTVAGIPGGANLPIYDALATAGTVRHVLARHEQGAGFIAHGMARLTGRPGVCLATSGPAATNTLTALADARLDSVPLVCMTGQVPSAFLGTDAFQEVDIYGMSLPVTKHNFQVRTAEELLVAVPEAFRIAASGRPGPVLIDVPKDVQRASVAVAQWPAPGRPAAPPPAAAPALDRAAQRLRQAERPLMLVGGGVILAGAATAAAELARRCDMPAACTLMGLGALPTDDPLALGLIGMHGSRYANRLLEACDLLLAVGMRFDDRATGKVEAFCPQARVIHVDIDASELGKIKAPTLAVAADARLALEGLLERLAPAGRPAWRAAVERSRSAAPLLLPGAEDPRRPYGLIRTVGELLGPKGVVATDVGQHQMWVAQAYPFRAPRRWLTSGGLGTMGFGLPAAIGAALAEPEATVACFTGDGSLLMNIQELATLAEEDLNVKVILLDNRALGLVRQQQELFYGARFCASEFRAPTDFPTIAQGFGLPVCRLGEEADAEGALRGALTRAGPCLIHVPVERTEAVYPMVAPGAANSEMIGGEIHADATA